MDKIIVPPLPTAVSGADQVRDMKGDLEARLAANKTGLPVATKSKGKGKK